MKLITTIWSGVAADNFSKAMATFLPDIEIMSAQFPKEWTRQSASRHLVQELDPLRRDLDSYMTQSRGLEHSLMSDTRARI